jgi:hypothetical protein
VDGRNEVFWAYLGRTAEDLSDGVTLDVVGGLWCAWLNRHNFWVDRGGVVELFRPRKDGSDTMLKLFV